MKKIVTIFILLGMIVTGCDSNKETLITETKQDENSVEVTSHVKELEKEIEELERAVRIYREEKELFPFISNKTLEFVRAHASKDKEKLREMFADNVKVEERADGLYAIYPFKNEMVEWRLYGKETSHAYMDMVIQGYKYEESKNMMLVHVREFYKDQSPPTFLNLTFKQFNGDWKVVSVEFDI